MTQLFFFNNLQKCEGCDNTSMQINEYGLVRPCQECSASYRNFVNQHGADPDEAPTVYIDNTNIHEKPVVALIDRKKDHLLLPNGTIIPLPTLYDL